ncbi:MAG: M13 family metallopeptidase [Bacteroidales bacterium]|nr:M13 family metallopeptidase [Bacteroidales bacterium]
MKKQIALSILCLTIFYSCNQNKKTESDSAEKPKKEMKNSLNTALNPDDMDISVSPGEDFNLYANGGWMKNNPVPCDKSRYGTFDALSDLGQKQVRTLIEELANDKNNNDANAIKIGAFYAVGMDTIKIDKDGISPIIPEMEKINAIKDFNQVMELIAYLHKREMNPLFSIYADADSKNSEMIIAQLTQGGMGLPDRDYYLLKDERMKLIQAEYKKHIAKMLDLAGLQNTTESSERIFELEKRLATACMTKEERREPHNTYNKTNLDGIAKICPSVDWKKYFSAIGLENPGNFNITQPNFFKEINKLAKDISVETWKEYLQWNLIAGTASFLNSALVNERFNFYGKVLSGTKELQPRWKRVVNMTNSALSEAVGQIYVKKHFPPEAKEKMIELTNNLKIAFGERIKNLEWMGEATKQEALKKLEKINVKVGYPDKWRDYSKLEVKKDFYVLNVLRANIFEFDYMISKINKPVDREEWHMPPQMVNAYYDPSMNEIVFPAAILQPPFFYLGADEAVNYGAIGVVIGHEMTHGFDDQGRKYDLEGNLNDWWTKEDATKFDERAKKLIDRFNGFEVLDGMFANGVFTLGENIADLGGLCISYTALQIALKKNPMIEKIGGFDQNQRFFLAYAHVWAQNITNEEIAKRTNEDPHSLGEFRVNGPLPNMQEFYEAFGIKETDKMFLAEDKRAKIW